MRINNGKKTLFESFVQHLAEDDENAVNIDTYISHYEYQPEIEPEDYFRSSGDSSYFTVVKNEREAAEFNYHSDYWGSADQYQEDNVELVSSLEYYIESGDKLYFREEDGNKHYFTVTGVAIDRQYNSISHTKILIKEDKPVKESVKLNETTNKGIQAKKDDLYNRIRQALKDAGEKEWENIVGYVNRLPKEQADMFDKEETELGCIDMIHSILTYGSERNIDNLVQNEYLKRYIDELGEDKVRELLAGEVEEYKNATINKDVYTDGEGVTYNSVTFKDDLEESDANVVLHEFDEEYEDLCDENGNALIICANCGEAVPEDYISDDERFIHDGPICLQCIENGYGE